MMWGEEWYKSDGFRGYADMRAHSVPYYLRPMRR